MSIYNSHQWFRDLDLVIEKLPELSLLEGKSVLITGAAGLICSSIVDIFFRYNERCKQKIRILCAGRWPEEMESRFGDYTKRDEYSFVCYDASKDNNLFSIACDYIVHGASNAFPSMIVKEPVETMLANFNGIHQLLRMAENNKTKRVLYISSSEVYGQKEGSSPFKEDDYGFIDLLNPRNSYSVGKRAAETLCASFSQEYGTETVIVRPGHIYGPTASPQDNRVSSAWAYDVAMGKSIVMKSDGLQLRSYCYCLDCASAIIKVLLLGKTCEAYNISNPSSVITIADMAELLSEIGKVELVKEVASTEERSSFNPMSNSSLDSARLMELGWKGLFDARTGFSHTVSILKDIL